MQNEPDPYQIPASPPLPPQPDPAAEYIRRQLDEYKQTSTTVPAVEKPAFALPDMSDNTRRFQTQPGTIPNHLESTTPDDRSPEQIKRELLNQVRRGDNPKIHRWRPLIAALVVGTLFLSVSYNEVALAQIQQYISPGRSLTTPVIVDPTADVAISNDPRILIPKINVDVPVVYDEPSFEEAAIQAALERGVVHYGNTALPGQAGNNVIVGHSSNNFFNSGKYKFAFVLLDRLEIGDTFILHYGGERYIYKVFNKEVIEPTDLRLVQPTPDPIATLITCTPPGTSWRRLVIQGEQISPNPNAATEVDITDQPESINNTIVPGNAPSFWDNLFDIF
jgi:sortase A